MTPPPRPPGVSPALAQLVEMLAREAYQQLRAEQRQPPPDGREPAQAVTYRRSAA